MQTYSCACGQRLFFDNTQCLRCWRTVGWCPCCRTIAGLDATGMAWRYVCTRCHSNVRVCQNSADYDVCNRCVVADQPPPGGTIDRPLCDMCQFNSTIPDLSVPGNQVRWQRLEAAKRRVLRQFQLLRLPPYFGAGSGPPLRFDFKADAIPTDQGWRPMGQETVYTGHAEGRVTINVREADSVEREKLRVAFGESHRTLAGHFRHELAHYLYDTCVAGSDRRNRFDITFGDPNSPPYGDALNRYYQQGPSYDWPNRYVSAYASMHPLEDWAETTAALLEIHGLLETARHHGYAMIDLTADAFSTALTQFADLCVFLNEVNRDIGLPEVLTGQYAEPVRQKFTFAHDTLMRACGR